MRTPALQPSPSYGKGGARHKGAFDAGLDLIRRIENNTSLGEDWSILDWGSAVLLQ
jgi:predicted heme/steroid binding protein